jgi:hypothetical protein
MAIHCVNHKSHAVIDLASELGVSPLIAAAKISLWQEVNGLEKFPTVDELHTASVVKENAKPEQKLTEPISEIGLSDEVNFHDLVDENAPNTLDEEISYDPEVEVFTENLFKGDLSVDNILSNISTGISDLTPYAQDLATRAARIMGGSKAKVELVDEEVMISTSAVMQYDPVSKKIQVSSERIKGLSEKDVVVAFLHEVVHSITADALAKDPKNRTLAEKELVEVVDKFMKKYKDSDLAEEYGFKNEFEFVAEFYSNPEFRDQVKSESEGLWNQFINAIRRFFNIPLNSEYTTLFNTIMDFNEQNVQDENEETQYKGVFAKELEFVKPEMTSFENKLDELVKETKDRIAQARARTAKTKKPISRKDKKDHLKNIDALIKEMDKMSETQKVKVILGYANTLNKTVIQVTKGLERLHKKTKDYRDEDLLKTINSYEEYLAAYDLIDDISKLVGASVLKKDLTEEEVEDFNSIRKIISYAAGESKSLKSQFHAIKNEQAVKFLANPKFNTQVETDHRNRLYKEYVDKKITGESRIEYASRMLTTRDKDLFEEDLIKAAEKIVYNPAFDISSFKKNFEDPLNTNSKLIQIITNMISAARDTIIDLYKDYDLALKNVFNDLVKEKGNLAPSELYKDIYEQDKDGNYFFKGIYSVKFRDIYLEEYKPMELELSELKDKLKAEGAVMAKDFMKNDEYKALYQKTKAWMKEHTVRDQSDEHGLKWYPKDKYRNTKPTGASAEMLKEAVSLAKLGHTTTGGSRSLVRKTGQVSFYKFPSITKSDFERGVEKDFKGLVKQKWTDATEIKPDDVGYGEAIDNKTGESVRGVKVHYRGDIDPKTQSLDVATMLRKEYFNVISFREKSKVETNAIMLADVSKSKRYFQTSTKTGLPLMNIWNKNQPVVTIPGEFTNEYKRIKGLMDRMIYDVFHEHGGRLGPLDGNKIVSYVNGATASIAMSLNVASGTANLFNGFTQLFIESFGGDVISPKNLLKAEKLYGTELPNTLSDLSNPVKTSFVNQTLEMYDVFGGFDPATQEYLRNTLAKKLASRKNMNGINEVGEHMMNSILTMAVLDSLKVMNSDNKFIDKNGKVVDESKASSLLDMLKMDNKGKLVMDDKVKFTKHNLTTEYAKGGKTHINLLIKSKVFDLYGVYDNNFKNELSKTISGKLVMMFKNFFLGALAYRYTGISTSLKSREDLTEDELNYSSAKKEYTEGIYTSLARYFVNGVVPSMKSMQLMYMKDVYNSLSDHEKANLKKATLEIMLTSVILPAIGALIAGAAAPDDDELWFLVYQLRRLESELSQFRDPRETAKILTNPVAGIKLIQTGLDFIQQVVTPINFFPEDDENFFSYLDEDAKHKNELVKATKRLVPIWSQLDKDYYQLYTILE